MINSTVPVLGIIARSGTGKTTLLVRLLPLLRERGLRIGVIKASHHDFEIDRPGKDSHLLRSAGASPVMITSPYRRALITEHPSPRTNNLADELAHFDMSQVDLILLEGFRNEPIPKIEVHRTGLDNPLLAADDTDIIAVAADDPSDLALTIPVLDLNHPLEVAEFVSTWLRDLMPPTMTDLVSAPDPCAETIRPVLTLDQAVTRILEAITPIAERETISLAEARGRTLAATAHAPFPLPPFPNSAMDGYALRSQDLDDPRVSGFQVVGKSLAGNPYQGSIEAGQCLRIFTGAPLPPQVDTVVMQEHVAAENNTITLRERPRPGANVRPAGDDAPEGSPLVPAGKQLTPADIGLLASAGIAEIVVTRKLRVAHFSTGDELTPLSAKLEFGQIHDSNRYLLQGLLDHPGVESRDLGIVRDRPDAIAAALEQGAAWADLVLSSGGVSVGEADFVTAELSRLGRIDFWKIAFKPGKPFAFGQIGHAWFCGLPGNPVAVVVSFLQLVRPALHRLAGAPYTPPLRIKAISTAALRKSMGRMEFQRGTFAVDDSGSITVSPCGAQGSHRLTGISQANCLIVLPTDCGGVAVGDRVDIEPLCELW